MLDRPTTSSPRPWMMIPQTPRRRGYGKRIHSYADGEEIVARSWIHSAVGHGRGRAWVTLPPAQTLDINAELRIWLSGSNSAVLGVRPCQGRSKSRVQNPSPLQIPYSNHHHGSEVPSLFKVRGGQSGMSSFSGNPVVGSRILDSKCITFAIRGVHSSHQMARGNCRVEVQGSCGVLVLIAGRKSTRMSGANPKIFVSAAAIAQVSRISP